MRSLFAGKMWRCHGATLGGRFADVSTAARGNLNVAGNKWRC